MTEAIVKNALVVKGKLVCVALNDKAHLAAMEEQFNQDPYKKPPTQPVLYYKPRNTWSTDGATIEWPTDSEAFVVGASLGLVIGRETCRVSDAEALDYLEGYTLVHDFSLPEKSYYRPDIKGKCLDGSAPVGPSVVSAHQITDPNQLTVMTAVNGETQSELSVANLYRGAAELISTISYIMTLQPGDVIATGFPCNRVAVKPGDTVVSTIEGVGALTNKMGGA